MIIDLDNIGGIRFVPYGGASPVTYGWSDLRLIYSQVPIANISGTVFGWSTLVYSGRASFDSVRRRGSMLPGVYDPTKPILSIDDRVYIDGARILLSRGGHGTVNYGFGGYLGAKTVEFDVRYYDGGTGSIATAACVNSFSGLGIVHAPYSGGLRVAGLTVGGPVVPTGKTGEYQYWFSPVRRNGEDLELANEYWDDRPFSGGFRIDMLAGAMFCDWDHLATTGATPPTP